MNRLFVTLVVALAVSVSADGHAQPQRAHRHHLTAASKASTKRRARHPQRTRAHMASGHHDELALSPSLIRQLQHNLVDGGYSCGPIDGRLTPQTHRALAEFQRDYHLRDDGRLDRLTAQALLGHDAIAPYTLASTK